MPALLWPCPVALVDKKKARLFTVFMGQIEESTALDVEGDGLEDLTPSTRDRGPRSQVPSPHRPDAVHWHLKRVARQLAKLLRRRSFDRLILAGPEEATRELQRLLPRALAHRLVGLIPGELLANERETLEKTLAVERRVEREIEERLLDELIEKAGSGGRATCGPEPTLEVLWLGEIQTLVVADDVDAVGSECPNCGRLVSGKVPACPACGHATRPVHDPLRRAITRARDLAGKVEVVHDGAARRLQEVGGGLGALLRYRWTAAAPTG